MGLIRDITGQKFGKLTAIEPCGRDKDSRLLWLCKCDCGNTVIKSGHMLTQNHTKSCGCGRGDAEFNNNEPKRKAMIGNRYGRLIVIEEVIGTDRSVHNFRCKCDCGNEPIVNYYQLIDGKTKSCGCYHKDVISTHKLSKTRIYRVWKDMRSRCQDPRLKNYPNYGGRGISVCKEWDNSFEAFYAWSIANDYDETAPRGICTIDRIDVNGNYEPSNCRWATAKEQARNRQDTVYLTYDGKTLRVCEWSELTGIPEDVIRARMFRGWSIEKTLTEPYSKRKLIEYNGEEKTVSEWCKIFGIKFTTAYNRLKYGWSVEDTFTTPVDQSQSHPGHKNIS